VRIVKKIKYAYDTRVDTQVCRNAALYFLLTYGAVAVFETTVGIGSLKFSWATNGIMGEGSEAGRARELGRRERRREGRGRESSYKFVPPHLRKRSDAPVLPQYDSRMIRFRTLKYVRMIPKI